MRGADAEQSQIFSYLSPEARVRKDHPLRAIRVMVDEVLAQMSGSFDAMYADAGRPSIAPEKLLGHSCCRCCTRCAASAC
jgi:transposase